MGVLDGKKTVISGGAQGLGQALALRLAREGCDVGIADLQEEAAAKTVEEIRQLGRQAFVQHADVTNVEDVDAFFALAEQRFGRVDIAVANAAILVAEPIAESDPGKWRAVMNVNLFGYYLFARAAARLMKAQGSGCILQINSKSGKKGSAKNSAYAASKFGGIGLTQSLALELAEHGVRCNAICPGNLLDSPLWTGTLYKQYARNQGISEAEVRRRYLDQVPLRRGCTYDDVANVMVFLASEQAAYMTGQAINVTGGQEMR